MCPSSGRRRIAMCSPLGIQPAQLLQGLVLDLADALPADLALLADLRQGVLVAVASRLTAPSRSARSQTRAGPTRRCVPAGDSPSWPMSVTPSATTARHRPWRWR